jgi:HAE1 family hydrophobic/amphiphilic exporter-1
MFSQFFIERPVLSNVIALVMMFLGVVALAVLPVSWLVAAILLASGPLLPVLMSLIGSRAREMGRRQLEETADALGVAPTWTRSP